MKHLLLVATALSMSACATGGGKLAFTSQAPNGEGSSCNIYHGDTGSDIGGGKRLAYVGKHCDGGEFKIEISDSGNMAVNTMGPGTLLAAGAIATGAIVANGDQKTARIRGDAQVRSAQIRGPEQGINVYAQGGDASSSTGDIELDNASRNYQDNYNRNDAWFENDQSTRSYDYSDDYSDTYIDVEIDEVNIDEVNIDEIEVEDIYVDEIEIDEVNIDD